MPISDPKRLIQKRGDSFSRVMRLRNRLNGEAFDLTGHTVRSEIRRRDVEGTLVQVLDATIQGDPQDGLINLNASHADTASWPLETLLADVQFTRIADDFRFSSKTFLISVVSNVTD